MRLSKNFVLKQLAVVTGLIGAGTLLSLPALAAASLHSEGITIAQSAEGSGTTDSGQSGVNPANPDATGGEGFENAPGSQPLPNSNEQDNSGSTMDEGTGSGTGGGVQQDGVNPANPDAEGGEAFEREPSGEPLPSENQGMDDSTTNPSGSPSGNPSGTTTNEGSGSGLGGTNTPNSVNPANPDPTGGEAYERTPGTQPLPQGNEQSGGASGTMGGSGTTTNQGTYNQSGQTGTTTNGGVGGGAGGETTGPVRALW